jgi:hypothetical protein
MVLLQGAPLYSVLSLCTPWNILRGFSYLISGANSIVSFDNQYGEPVIQCVTAK